MTTTTVLSLDKSPPQITAPWPKIPGLEVCSSRRTQVEAELGKAGPSHQTGQIADGDTTDNIETTEDGRPGTEAGSKYARQHHEQVKNPSTTIYRPQKEINDNDWTRFWTFWTQQYDYLILQKGVLDLTVQRSTSCALAQKECFIATDTRTQTDYEANLRSCRFVPSIRDDHASVLSPGEVRHHQNVVLSVAAWTCHVGHPLSCCAWGPSIQRDDTYFDLVAIGGYGWRQSECLVGDRVGAPSTIELLLFSRADGLKHFAVIHHEYGSALDLAFASTTADGQTMGVLAAVTHSGKVLVMTLPSLSIRDSPQHISLDSESMTIDDEVAATRCVWHGLDLVVAYADGKIQSWQVSAALRDGQSTPARLCSVAVNDGPICALLALETSARRATPASGSSNMTEAVVGFDIACIGYDGSSYLVNLERGEKYLFNRNIAPNYALAYSPHTNSFVHPFPDGTLRYINQQTLSTKLVMPGHSGPILSLSTSPFHPLVLSAGSDGAVLLMNPMSRLGQRHGKEKVGLLYQVEYEDDGGMGEEGLEHGRYRMIDNLHPLCRDPRHLEDLQRERSKAARKAKTKKSSADADAGTRTRTGRDEAEATADPLMGDRQGLTFPKEWSIHQVLWHPRVPDLAVSVGASGLVRIDRLRTG